ncbi:MAG: YciI family protein [Bryobacteraceae bacterium]
MAQFLLLLHESPTAFEAVPREEMGRVIGRYMAWRQSLQEKGKLLGSNKLADEGGRLLSREGGGAIRVVDGPFAEAKEIIGGYFLLTAGSYDEAVELARSCPHLDYGTIELRRVDLMEEPKGA